MRLFLILMIAMVFNGCGNRVTNMEVHGVVEVEGLALERDGQVIWLDTLNPK